MEVWFPLEEFQDTLCGALLTFCSPPLSFMHSFICRHRVSLNVQRVASQTFDRQNNFCKHLLFAIWISSSPLNVSSSLTKRASSLSKKKWCLHLKFSIGKKNLLISCKSIFRLKCLNYCGLKSKSNQWAGYSVFFLESFPHWRGFRSKGPIIRIKRSPS